MRGVHGKFFQKILTHGPKSAILEKIPGNLRSGGDRFSKICQNLPFNLSSCSEIHENVYLQLTRVRSCLMFAYQFNSSKNAEDGRYAFCSRMFTHCVRKCFNSSVKT